MIKKLLILPAIIFMSQASFADKRGNPPPQQDQGGYDEPMPDYQGQAYGDGYAGGYVGGAGPCCGAAVMPPPIVPCCAVYPPPPPPPVHYYCGMPTCGNVYPPYGPPVRPWIPRPTPYAGGGFGPRPFPYGTLPRGGGGMIAGIPGGMVRPMSNAGCEVQQGNNGEFSVISAEGQVLYKSDLPKAEANAEFMKSHYEKNSDLCGGGRSPAKSLDI